MSFSPCPICSAPLEGYPGSPCSNPNCINGRRNREREEPRFIAPLSGQVTTEHDVDQRTRKARRKAARMARRGNRR